MRQYVGLAALIFVGIGAWRIAGQLSADALGMGVGVLFGVMAGVPMALMVMASGRRRAVEEEEVYAPSPPTATALQAMAQQPHPAYYGGYGPGAYPPRSPP